MNASKGNKKLEKQMKERERERERETSTTVLKYSLYKDSYTRKREIGRDNLSQKKEKNRSRSLRSLKLCGPAQSE